MAELQLTLTAEEREYLIGLLEEVLKETRIEEHRTRTLNYRKFIINQEEKVVQLLSKLGRPNE